MNKKTDVSTKQCHTIKFCARLKKKISIVETIALLKEAFQDETLHDLTIRSWHRAFTDDRKSVEIKRVGGNLKTVIIDVNINTVSEVTEEDHH